MKAIIFVALVCFSFGVLGGDLFEDDIQNWGLINTLTGHASPINSVAISPDGNTLASGSDDKFINLWIFPSGDLIHTLAGHTDVVKSVAFSPDNLNLASGGADNTVIYWDVLTGDLFSTMTGHTGAVNTVAFSPDGSKLVSGSSDNVIKIWNTPWGGLIHTIYWGDMIFSVAISPDGTKLAGGTRNGVRLWKFPSGEHVKDFTHDANDEIFSIAFDPEGRRLATGLGINQDGAVKGAVKVWDAQATLFVDGNSFFSGHLIKTLEKGGHADSVNSVAWSRDGQKIVTGSRDLTVKYWDYYAKTSIGRNQLIATMNGHTGFVNSVAFSRDGTKIVSGSSDNTIKIWEENDVVLVTSRSSQVASFSYFIGTIFLANVLLVAL